MKVILTAFCSELTSGVKEYPEETGRRITLRMPMDGRRWVEYNGIPSIDEIPQPGFGVFEDTGLSFVVGAEPVREYRLIEWHRQRP